MLLMKAHTTAPAEHVSQTKMTQRATEGQAIVGTFGSQHPEAITQRQRQNLMDNSPQVQQQKARSALLSNSAVQMQSRAENHHLNRVAQRVEEDEPLQGRFETECSAQLQTESPPKANNTGLPNQLKAGVESLSGMSLDHVKVHYNSAQPAQLNALAYAQGSDIHVGPGQEQHLPHEAWHVVQQAQGRVKPTMQMKEGVPVNDDAGLEHEADVMGAKALASAPTQLRSNLTQHKHNHASTAPVQMVRTVASTANFTFDNAGVKTAPANNDSDPIARSAWVNEMIGLNLITHANNDAIYKSGHQVAARFGGSNAGDNIAAWPDRIEAAYSTEEDRVDGGAANMHGVNPEPTRADETGVLTVTTNYQNADVLVDSMVTAAWTALAGPLALQTNWRNLNPGADPAVVNPPNAPTQATVGPALKARFRTQQQQVSDSNLAESTSIGYAATNLAGPNPARSFAAATGAIALPTWTATAATWTTFLQVPANKPRIQDGANYRLELP